MISFEEKVCTVCKNEEGKRGSCSECKGKGKIPFVVAKGSTLQDVLREVEKAIQNSTVNYLETNNMRRPMSPDEVRAHFVSSVFFACMNAANMTANAPTKEATAFLTARHIFEILDGKNVLFPAIQLRTIVPPQLRFEGIFSGKKWYEDGLKFSNLKLTEQFMEVQKRYEEQSNSQ